ncbi:hypothetical protein [Actinoplanes flavus]|uniref:Uncharacterized protein n=1 Tax=Actinoplanes flavus TaxID=2820290 RepID=A0ABS3UH65_9ACTN|nr:hypothetical protein [Actinoplanes flavus]MBO3738124.1 hypothetical protein [Actinoplanes flavus]
MIAIDKSKNVAERRQRIREERQVFLRKLEKDLAGPPPFRVTLAQARAEWPRWEAAHNERRERGRRAAEEKHGLAVANLLVDLYLPKLPSSTEIVVYALSLECGHEGLRLLRHDTNAKPALERSPCPISWKCQLGDNRTAARYIVPGEPEAKLGGFGLTRWSVQLACGHEGDIWRAEGEESRVGDFLICGTCEGADPDADVEIIALGEPLPDLMVQNWTVELNCGHTGTDHGIPVEDVDDPGAYRSRNPWQKGLHCSDGACAERAVHGVRRLGNLGKVRPRKPATPAPPDPVEQAAKDLRRRLTKEQRQALAQQLQNERE